MANEHKPSGWGWNPSVIGLCIIVAGLIGGGGYYLGQQDRTIEQLKQDATEAKRIAVDARQIAIGDSGVPIPEPTAMPIKTTRR